MCWDVVKSLQDCFFSLLFPYETTVYHACHFILIPLILRYFPFIQTPTLLGSWKQTGHLELKPQRSLDLLSGYGTKAVSGSLYRCRSVEQL